MTIQKGSVIETLTRMRGVWHDKIAVYDLAGRPLSEDTASGTPGPSPFENLVYIDFDGETYRQTNVTIQGRPFHVRSFQGKIVDGILQFNQLGPNDPQHVGVSGGYGRIIFAGKNITDAWLRYAEPDFIQLNGDRERTRLTLLYRNGVATRTLCAQGTKLAPCADKMHEWDPRGSSTSVHESINPTKVFAGVKNERKN